MTPFWTTVMYMWRQPTRVLIIRHVDHKEHSPSEQILSLRLRARTSLARHLPMLDLGSSTYQVLYLPAELCYLLGSQCGSMKLNQDINLPISDKNSHLLGLVFSEAFDQNHLLLLRTTFHLDQLLLNRLISIAVHTTMHWEPDRFWGFAKRTKTRSNAWLTCSCTKCSWQCF